MEKESELGGILKSESAIPFKYEMYQLTGTYAQDAIKSGVEIRLNCEATKELVEAEHPDALIIAAGSTPLIVPIPGLTGPNVVVVNNYYQGEGQSRRRGCCTGRRAGRLRMCPAPRTGRQEGKDCGDA